jgi:hypothetical protein
VFRCLHGLAEDLLDQGLGRLLAWFGDEVGLGQAEPERIVEAGDLAPGEGGAEDHVRGPVDLEGSLFSQLLGETPAPEMLHRPGRNRLGPRT